MATRRSRPAPARPEPRPRISLVLTGGTIQSEGQDRLDLAGYMDNGRQIETDELLRRVPELSQIARIETTQFANISSSAIGEAHWLDLARLLHQRAEAGADGIVVTHGTNTLEETAYFLHLVLKVSVPVVLVGAMRPASTMSADGDLNLVNAVRTAGAPAAAGMGVLVVMNDAIYSARDVTKGSTFRVHAFEGRDLGPLGFADPDKIVFYHRPVRAHTLATPFEVRTLTALRPVPVLVSHVGAGGELIDAAVSAGARGIVIGGSGAGGVTPEQDEAVTRACETGVVVCRAGRVGSGRVLERPDTARKSIVSADNLVPWKARILLALALTLTSDAQVIQGFFDQY